MSRAYRVLLAAPAERDLRRLRVAATHDRIIAAIRALAGDPRPPGSRKLTGSDNDWRIRCSVTQRAAVD